MRVSPNDWLNGTTGRLLELKRRAGAMLGEVRQRSDAKSLRLAGHYLRRRFLPALRYFRIYYKITSLTRLILVYNMIGLIILVGGILFLNQFRAGLIEVRVQNLLTQGKIIAEAIAASSTIDPAEQLVADPEAWMEIQSDHNAIGAIQDFGDTLDFPINPERAAPILLRLIQPTGTRARIYDREGSKLLDSRLLDSRGKILREELAPLGETKVSSYTRLKRWFKRAVLRGNVPLYTDIGPASGMTYEEVRQALNGRPIDMARMNERSELVVSVAVPIQRMRAVLGVLLLTTKGDDIDQIVADETLGIMRVALVALAVMLALSLWLSNQIGAPMRKLAEAARRVRHSPKAREEIPDFSQRTDEIGELSQALRNMTKSLYSRIEAIESFAADVAHELKNPLTSLKSAVETLPLAKKEEQRDRLMGIILHDVKRLDRLISDISDSSRLDAELAREESQPLDLNDFLANLIPAFNDIHRDQVPDVEFNVKPVRGCPDAFLINGLDTRIGQVFNNLVDNAISFSPQGGKVSVNMERLGDDIAITVEDEGPGIPPDNLKKVFKRFYTDRPEEQGFGNNSGLGLNISEQIITAHKGRIWAENRTRHARGKEDILGARFQIRLPAVMPCGKG